MCVSCDKGVLVQPLQQQHVPVQGASNVELHSLVQIHGKPCGATYTSVGHHRSMLPSVATRIHRKNHVGSHEPMQGDVGPCWSTWTHIFRPNPSFSTSIRLRKAPLQYVVCYNKTCTEGASDRPSSNLTLRRFHNSLPIDSTLLLKSAVVSWL